MANLCFNILTCPLVIFRSGEYAISQHPLRGFPFKGYCMLIEIQRLADDTFVVFRYIIIRTSSFFQFKYGQSRRHDDS